MIILCGIDKDTYTSAILSKAIDSLEDTLLTPVTHLQKYLVKAYDFLGCCMHHSIVSKA